VNAVPGFARQEEVVMHVRQSILVMSALLLGLLAAAGCDEGSSKQASDLGSWWLEVQDDSSASPLDALPAGKDAADVAASPDLTPEDLGPPCQPDCKGKECGDDDGCGKVCIVDAGCAGNPPCSDGVCDQSGVCALQPVEGDCDDGDPCTVGDHCSAGKCKAGSEFPDCDDGNACTNDLCDPVDGCYSTPNSIPCDDGDPCTAGDVCVDGSCASGAPNTCEDNNPCTDDWCEQGFGCHNDAKAPGFPCDDNNTCTIGDQCQNGQCTGGQIMNCDDFNSCTTDICSPGQGCIYQPKNQGSPCDDNNACTVNDFCDEGACKPGPAKDCDDYNDCTTDSCGAGGLCNHAPLTGDFYCDDGNPCTDPDYCDAGTCASGPEVPGCN
jgi:hypothetical protein